MVARHEPVGCGAARWCRAAAPEALYAAAAPAPSSAWSSASATRLGGPVRNPGSGPDRTRGPEVRRAGPGLVRFHLYPVRTKALLPESGGAPPPESCRAHWAPSALGAVQVKNRALLLIAQAVCLDMRSSPSRGRLSLVRNIISAAAAGQEYCWRCISQLLPQSRCRRARFHAASFLLRS